MQKVRSELEQVWQRYCQGGVAALEHASYESAQGHLYAALLARAEGDRDRAHAHAAGALARDPQSALCRQLHAYLGGADTSIYAEGKAFAAFIRGGGNRVLYQRLTDALRRAYGRRDAMDLLDIGVGDGLALLDAVSGDVQRIVRHVEVIEPSAPMLARVTAELDRRDIAYRAHGGTLEQFVEAARGRWHVAQATFSLHCIAPEQRVPLLAWLRERCDELLIAEFDVPIWQHGRGPDRGEYLLSRYEKGLSEYGKDQDLVAQGFLMPILASQFAGDGNQTHEQPTSAWQQDCMAAGFGDVSAELINEYWWADAYLITARK